MPELLKNIYDESFFYVLTKALKENDPDFDSVRFLKLVKDKEWNRRELKQRMKHIAFVLESFLEGDFSKKIKSVQTLLKNIHAQEYTNSLALMCFTEFIEMYGIDNLNESSKAMEFVTPFASCEFAVRPFIIRYPEKMMDQMLKWSNNKNEHVRRLASEGSRPRLPWGMALPVFKKDPSAVLPILENLKQDSSLYVRRSVANNLNDIAKDNPEVVLNIISRWAGNSQETDWILKHGCRTLLKKANPAALNHFGFNPKVKVEIAEFILAKKIIKRDEKLNFSFKVASKESKTVRLRLEYGIDYLKANGKLSRKIFKITENSFDPKKTISFTRNQSLHDMTTRKHYPGEHRIALLVNGKELILEKFHLIEAFNSKK